MAESLMENGPSSSTVVVEATSEPATVPAVRIKLRKPKNKKRVAWTPDTIDNENLNKKKSKCCCIYEKPREFDESSSDTDDECEHCKGHVERRRRQNPSSGGDPKEEGRADKSPEN